MELHAFGQLFRRQRRGRDLTQQDLASSLHVSPQAVSKWERGECLPDMSLLPEICRILNINMADVLTYGREEELDLNQVLHQLTNAIDEPLFSKMLEIVKRSKSADTIPIPLDAFMFLNQSQKARMLKLLFSMENYNLILDELIPYTNNALRDLMVDMLLKKKDFDNLEILIPFSSKLTKTKMMMAFMENHQFDYIEAMMPFLNRDQKEMIIAYMINQHHDMEILENFIPFFDFNQKKTILKALESQDLKNNKKEHSYE